MKWTIERWMTSTRCRHWLVQWQRSSHAGSESKACMEQSDRTATRSLDFPDGYLTNTVCEAWNDASDPSVVVESSSQSSQLSSVPPLTAADGTPV